MRYDNIDADSGELTYKGPNAFPAKIVNNNCLTFNGTSDYVALGETFTGIKKVSFWIKRSDSTYRIAIMNHFGVSSQIAFSSVSMGLGIGNYNYGVTLAYDTNFHFIEIENVSGGKPIVYVDGVVKAVNNPSSWSVALQPYFAIGAGCLSSATQYSQYFKGSIFDVKLYDADDNLIHHYPMAEGDDIYVYDAVGGKHGKLVTSSVATCWNQKQNAVAYNTTDGFKQDSDQSIAITKAKVPLGANPIIYKSNFHTSVDGGYSYSGTYETIGVSNNAFVCSSNSLDNLDFCHSANLSLSQLGRKFHAKFYIENLSNINITSIRVIVGSLSVSSGLGYLTKNVTLASGESTIIDVDIPVASGSNFASVIRIYVTYASTATAGSPISMLIKDIEITQVDYLEQHNPVYGLNNSEASLDYTQGISNVSELGNVTSTKINASNISSVGPVYANIIDNGSMENILVYKDDQDGINLDRVKNHVKHF